MDTSSLLPRTAPRVGVLLAVMSLACSAAAQSTDSASLWAAAFQGPRGVTLSWNGVPIIRQSTLYVVKPGWSGLLYDQRAQTTRVESRSSTSLRADAANTAFRASYTLEALDARRFRYRFEGELLQEAPAEIEFCAGYFNANLLSGRRYRAVTRHGETSGVIAAYPRTADQSANDLAPDFQVLEFESRIGRLRVEATSAQPVRFFDARRDRQDWAKAAPIFWCGLGSPTRPIRRGEPVRFELLLTLTPGPAPAEPAAEPVTFRPRGVTAATAAPEPRALNGIIPRPKQVEAGKGEFAGDPTLGWELSAPATDRHLMDEARELLADALGQPAPAGTFVAAKGPAVRLRLGNPSSLKDRDERWLQSREGYRLAVTPPGIEVRGASGAGAFYGVQTLRQLLRPVDGGFRARCATIRDWPTLAFRGAHFFPSASGVRFQNTLLSRVFSRFKLNHAVIQCEAAKWEAQPKIAAPNSISVADLKTLVATARAHYLEAIPLLNGPGHAEWLFRNGENRDLCEDPATPYAYCVRNPKAQGLVREIVAEAIRVFGARTVHLGHDEVTLRGRFPRPDCPRCGRSSATELVLENLREVEKWLSGQGIRTLVWGDMFLARGEALDAAHAPSTTEAAKRRAGLPRGVTVVDWHYGADEQYPSLDVFARSLIPTIAATWHDPRNIAGFARAAAKSGAEGLLQTTWAGYFPDEKALRSELRQFSAFVLAAEYAWSGREDAPEDLPYDPGAVFTEALRGPERGVAQQVMLELPPVARVPRADWLGLGAGWDLTKAPRGEQEWGGIRFQIPDDRLLVVGGPGSPRGAAPAANLELDRPFVEAALLNAAVWSGPPGTPVALVRAEYADGTSVEAPLRLGETTGAWNSDTPALEAPRVWQGRSPEGTPLGLRLTRWRNPHPEKVVRRLVLSAAGPEPGLALAGITLLTRKEP